MSAKSQFLKKLQSHQSASIPFISKSQADIDAFRLRMTQLHEQMDAWLTGTGLNVETLPVSVSDLLVEGGTFDISGIVLRYEGRTIKFIPLFLYGHGVTGCVEVTLHSGEYVTSPGRLFMRESHLNDWTFKSQCSMSVPGLIFDEDTFFHLISGLLS